MSSVQAVWLGGWAPRSVCTTPASRPTARAEASHTQPARGARASRLTGHSQGRARATKAMPLEAWPPGKHRPGPPSNTPQAQCDTAGTWPPKSDQSQGQLVALAFFTRFTASRLSTDSTATVRRSLRGRPSCLAGHSAQTHTATITTVAAWRKPSCSTRSSHHWCCREKPVGEPIQRMTVRSAPLASHIRVRSSKASQPRSKE